MQLHLLKCSCFQAFYLMIMLIIESQAQPAVPALIIFGDSIVDTGNNNLLSTLAKCNFPPYGRDFKGQKATGRFSNGKVPSDLLASNLGIKEFLPAYLDPELKEEDLLTGVSFASGAAGYDNITSQLPKVLSLWDQLELFKEYKMRVVAIVGEEKAAEIINEALYIVFSGSNDILFTYFVTEQRAKSYDLPSYLDFVVDAASSFFKELYNLGARRIGVIGVPPLGCVPAARTVYGGVARDCIDTFNQASTLFNNKLFNELQGLNTYLPFSKIMYMDIYNIVMAMVLKPSNYGFKVSSKGCCGTGKLEAAILCNELSPYTCEDTTNYVFWDSFHPTQKAFDMVVAYILRRYIKNMT